MALLNRGDPSHGRVKAQFDREHPPLVVPAGILCEVAYFIERSLGGEVLDGFLADLEGGQFTLDCGEADIPRIRELARRYADLPLGFVDAAVIACAERNGGRVLTLDLRDFGAVAREGTITILPD
jgi:hypothetical protein